MVYRSTSQRAKHPRKVEYNIADHEDIMNVMIGGGGNEDPSAAGEGAKDAYEQEEAGYARGGGAV